MDKKRSYDDDYDDFDIKRLNRNASSDDEDDEDDENEEDVENVVVVENDENDNIIPMLVAQEQRVDRSAKKRGMEDMIAEMNSLDISNKTRINKHENMNHPSKEKLRELRRFRFEKPKAFHTKKGGKHSLKKRKASRRKLSRKRESSKTRRNKKRQSYKRR